ncbi:unnamed protein product [Cuscuta epithymum]|uniref:Uncharacterized protein n=1 Tax=Cuscuta epithymum TaxID=186058 RepID=A0AAV0C726_9ASTE|nr:unnamed protein product [Cuscuta epithymum]
MEPHPSSDVHPHPSNPSPSDFNQAVVKVSEHYPLLTTADEDESEGACGWNESETGLAWKGRHIYASHYDESEGACGWTSSETDPGWKRRRRYGSHFDESPESVEEGEEVNSFDCLFPDLYADIFQDTP